MPDAQADHVIWNISRRTALVMGAGLLILAILLAWFAHAVLHQEFWTAVIFGGCVLWLGYLIVFISNFFRARHAGGAVLLDDGYHPMRSMNLTFGCFMLIAGVMLYFSVQSLENFLLGGFYLTYVIFACIQSSGRLQVREHGILIYADLLEWDRITAYCWEGSTLVVYARARFVFRERHRLVVSPECLETVDTILQERLNPPFRKGWLSGGAVNVKRADE